MPRWESGSRERLERAALELFSRDGFAATTVQAITDRAGLNYRSFFRHFADKQDVLTFQQAELHAVLADAIGSIPAGKDPIADVLRILRVVADWFECRARTAKERHAVIRANPELQERETTKLAALAGDLADGLVAAGVEPAQARIAAEAGILVFRSAFDSWATSERELLRDELLLHLQRLQSLLVSTDALGQSTTLGEERTDEAH